MLSVLGPKHVELGFQKQFSRIKHGSQFRMQASSGGAVVSTPKATCRMTNWSLVILQGLGSISQRWQVNYHNRVSMERHTTRGSGVPQPFHRLKWRQPQALPGEAQSSPFRKFGTISVDKSSCIYTVVVACISLHCEGSG